MTKIEEYNSIYGLIEKNSYVINPLVVSLSGGMAFGIRGAVLGFIISLVDEGLEQTCIMGGDYFTRSFIGASTFYNIYPSYVATGFGVAGGILVSTSTIGNYDVNNIIYPIIPVVIGATAKGIRGTVVWGVAVGAIDRLFIHFNITNKYYLTYSWISIACVNPIFGTSLIVNAAGAVLGTIFASYEENIDINLKSLDLSKNLYSTYHKVIESRQLTNHILAHAKTLLITQIALEKFLVKTLYYQQNMIYSFEHLNDARATSLNQLNSIALKFILFIIPFSLSKIASQIISSYYSTKLYLQFDDNLRDLLFTNETALRLSFDKNATVLIDNLRADSKVISYDGAILISDYVSKTIKGTYGFCILMKNSPDLLIYSAIYNKITQYISSYIANRQSELDSKIKLQESFIATELKHNMHNIRIINERGGVSHTKNKLSELYDILRIYEFERDQILIIFDAWIYFISTADFIYNYYIVGYKINTGKVNFDDRTNIHYSTWRVSKLLSWEAKKSKELKKIYRALERINLFLDKAKYLVEESSDKIVRVKNHSVHDKLVLTRLNITIKGDLLLKIYHCELNYGKVYVLTGPSGSGKSSLVSKIIEIKENQIGGNGLIFYPNNSKIILITQQDYFALNLTLQEVVFYPDIVNISKLDEVRSLLSDIGITKYALTQAENWYDVLSGGQKKKMMIISSIIKHPDILILDEAFNGLDKQSVQIMQNLITKHLSHSLVISIDHNVNENNRTGFYTDKIEIKNEEYCSMNLLENADVCVYRENSNFLSCSNIYNENI